ncbi:MULTISPECIES: GGDEF domain-containing protein [unclassified Devosia]|uniref:GGDEF domain-containing protein n=1 Tax=unclassified Devosia TaxID=196773 RepID=UPI00145E642B|nr:MULTISPECIES: GGDEF domain-containing protein [unclassified Devosia]MBJ6988814.1 GGDEF domain-containing protein [Devosia sp. MC521]QMW63628.1 GGDEF domain-containing protein [Devosia sp. MC521]
MRIRAISRITNAFRSAAARLGFLRTIAMLSIIVFALHQVSQAQRWSDHIPDAFPFADHALVLMAIIVACTIIVFLLFEISRVAREVTIVEQSDAITEVFTREHGAAIIRSEFNRALHNKNFLAVMILDIDSFKKINLQYGYAAGDKVLAMLVERCQSLLRRQDVIGRMGDAEFYVILPRTEILAAHIMAERLRAAVASDAFMLGGVPVAITISVGVAELEAEDTPETLIRRADAKLSVAKSEGKNRVR